MAADIILSAIIVDSRFSIQAGELLALNAPSGVRFLLRSMAPETGALHGPRFSSRVFGEWLFLCL